MKTSERYPRKIDLCPECGVVQTFYAGVYQRCADCHRLRLKRTRVVGKNLEKEREYGRRWAENNVDKLRVHRIVRTAKRNGTLVAPDRCERCGTDEDLHAHHDDYSKPLDVRWVCRRCHGIIHREREV